MSIWGSVLGGLSTAATSVGSTFRDAYNYATGTGVGTAALSNPLIQALNVATSGPVSAVNTLATGFSGAIGNAPSTTTRTLQAIPLIGGIAGAISAAFDNESKQPFNLFNSLALATDQLSRGIPWNSPRVQGRVQNFNQRAQGRFRSHLVAAGIPLGTTAEMLLSMYDWKTIGGTVRNLPIGTVVSAAQRAQLGVPTPQQLGLTGAPSAAAPTAAAPLVAPPAVPSVGGATPASTRRAVRQQNLAAASAAIGRPVQSIADFAQAQRKLTGSTNLGITNTNAWLNSWAQQRAAGTHARGVQAMPVGFLEALGQGASALGNTLGGFVNTALNTAAQNPAAVVQLLQGTGVLKSPQTQLVPYGGAAGPFAGLGFPQMPSTADQWSMISNAFDVPFIDVTPQGSAGTLAALTSPFYTTASGQQRAQPFAQVKANGKIEWFLPAGKPKTFSKARVIKSRRCPTYTCRPRRRRPR